MNRKPNKHRPQKWAGSRGCEGREDDPRTVTDGCVNCCWIHLIISAGGGCLVPMLRKEQRDRGKDLLSCGVSVSLCTIVYSSGEKLSFGAGTRVQVFPSKSQKSRPDFEKAFATKGHPVLAFSLPSAGFSALN